MVSPARPRRMSAYAVPALIVLALGFVAMGVRIGDGAVPLGSPRQPAAGGGPSAGRPAAQISARSDPIDAELAAAVGAIGELGPSRTNPRPVGDSPAAPGALPAPLRSPQPAPAPGTPSGPADRQPPAGEPPGNEAGLLDPPPAAGDELAELLRPILDLTAPVTEPVTTAVEETAPRQPSS
jgi:hypothetical protein